MSGIGPSELIVLVVVGLLILGPERLPRVATQIGRWVGKARRTANQLRYQLEREITLADIEGKKKKDKDAESKKSDKAADEAEKPDSDTSISDTANSAGAPDTSESDVKSDDAADTESEDEAKKP